MARRIPLASLDRTRVKWSRATLDETLRELWRARGGALAIAYTVHNVRKIAACRRRFGREGWRVRVQPQLKSNTLGIYIHMNRTGARPGKDQR